MIFWTSNLDVIGDRQDDLLWRSTDARGRLLKLTTDQLSDLKDGQEAQQADNVITISDPSPSLLV